MTRGSSIPRRINPRLRSRIIKRERKAHLSKEGTSRGKGKREEGLEEGKMGSTPRLWGTLNWVEPISIEKKRGGDD